MLNKACLVLFWHLGAFQTLAFHDITSGPMTACKQWRDKQVFLMSMFVYLSFCLCTICRSQAQQGPEAVPQLEVSEVFPRPRAAEDHPSQSVSPCCALWVKILVMIIMWRLKSGHLAWGMVSLTSLVDHFLIFNLMTHFLLASFSFVLSPINLILLSHSPINYYISLSSFKILPSSASNKQKWEAYICPNTITVVILLCITVH